MKSSTAATIEKICRDLGLPLGDSYTQDWIYELPEEFRSPEFFFRYVDAYSRPDYGKAEQQLLMQLMFDVVNDLLQSDEAVGLLAWSKLLDLLRANPELHRELVEYWALPGEPLEDTFRLTPFVRALQETGES
jgi:hypothetical protein